MLDADRKERKLPTDLSPLAVWAFSIGTSVGWGSLVVTSNTYLLQSGPMGSVLGLLLGAAIMLIISTNYAYMMQCYPESGGAYAFAREVFGYDHGFLAAWFLVLTYLAVFWANLTSLPLFAHYFFADLFRVGRLYTLFGYEVYLGEAMLSLLALLIFVLLCARFDAIAKRMMIFLALIFTLGIVAVFLGSLFGLDRSLSPAFVPDSSALSQIILIAVISPWAFIGFESVSHESAEFAFRRSRIFRVLVISLFSTLVLYVLVTLLSVTAYPPRYDSWLSYIADLGNLTGLEALPPFYAADHYLGSLGVGVLMAALLALIFTSLIGNLTALSRLLYALGVDGVLPRQIARLNRSGVPQNAIVLVGLVSILIPFLGRTAIGWIVDVTTIGATIIYAIVSASSFSLAGQRNDRTERLCGGVGFLLMALFLAYLLFPNLIAEGTLARESYFLFIIWSVLGFLSFRSILHSDHARRFGKSVIVWVALLALVLFVALIWMRQSMIASNHQMLENIRAHYHEIAAVSDARLADERFIQEQLAALERADSRTILMATAMFAFSLVIMLTNYRYMTKMSQESEQIAYTDPLTGVKSKHAYVKREQELLRMITDGTAPAFAIAVCDVNGLKHVNDSLGHKAGDNYIRAASAMICEIFDHSPVFRIGGDEFVVILTGGDFLRRDELLTSLLQRSESHIKSGEVVVAAGLAEYRAGEDSTAAAVFERADARMYVSKQNLKALGAVTR